MTTSDGNALVRRKLDGARYLDAIASRRARGPLHRLDVRTARPCSSPRELLPRFLVQRFPHAAQSFTQRERLGMMRGHAARAENVLFERFDQLGGMRDERHGNDTRLPRRSTLECCQNVPKLVAKGAYFPSLVDGSPTPSLARCVVHAMSHRTPCVTGVSAASRGNDVDPEAGSSVPPKPCVQPEQQEKQDRHPEDHARQQARTLASRLVAWHPGTSERDPACVRYTPGGPARVENLRESLQALE
jgi:hypothetical protein